MEALYDDLNTPKAFSLMHQLEPNILKATAQFLGFLKQESQTWFHGSNNLDINHIEKMIEQRIIAKKNKDFAQADSIRNTLKEKGILLEDTAQGTIWRKE
jgi:cysteinyl-tRNA synthetase